MESSTAADRMGEGLAVGGVTGEGPAPQDAAVRQLVLELVAEELGRFRREVNDKLEKMNSQLEQLSQRVDRRYY